MKPEYPIPSITSLGKAAFTACLVFLVPCVAIAQGKNVYQATLNEDGQRTPEVNTEELRRILVNESAVVLDTRKHSEFVAGHLPGARNLDVPPAQGEVNVRTSARVVFIMGAASLAGCGATSGAAHSVNTSRHSVRSARPVGSSNSASNTRNISAEISGSSSAATSDVTDCGALKKVRL